VNGGFAARRSMVAKVGNGSTAAGCISGYRDQSRHLANQLDSG